jgi:hypothetical protein
MGEFQLILLSERERPVKVRPSGAFSVVRFRRTGMAFSLPPHSPAVNLSGSRWLKPSEALARAQAALDDRKASIETIVNRLGAGLLKASYESVAWEYASRAPKLDPNYVEPVYWKYYEGSTQSPYVWSTGDLRLYLGNALNTMVDNSTVVTFFGVKIQREGIDEIVGNALPHPEPTPRASPTLSTDIVESEPPSNGPPVPEAHLQAWYEVYKQAYGGSSIDTEDFAHKSARGMFPNKSVTRKRIRDLRGNQKVGRKPKGA